MYDYLIVGSGLYGSVCARELTNKGFKCLVIDKRNHIGGNCYTEKIENINVHSYGPHIFHTSNEKVWTYINKFITLEEYKHQVVANFKNELYSLPFNMFTFNKLFGLNTPEEVKKKIDEQRFTGNPSNLEQQALSLVGKDVYEKLIKGYTTKQWMKNPNELPPSIIKRLPVRFTYDNNYFDDKYQGIPENGYTELFEKLLQNIEVKLNEDFFENRDYYESIAKKIIYTGPIDKFFNYEFGHLEYRPLRFEHEIIETENYQGTAQMNFTDVDVPFTRIIEHKHFENSLSDKTIITKEFPIEWKTTEEPYYPINDDKNKKTLNMYLDKASKLENVIFGGRLAEYKYYDMHQVIEAALKMISEINK